MLRNDWIYSYESSLIFFGTARIMAVSLLLEVQRWFSENRLLINADKTQLLCNTSQKEPLADDIVKLLGFVMYMKLSWEDDGDAEIGPASSVNYLGQHQL